MTFTTSITRYFPFFSLFDVINHFIFIVYSLISIKTNFDDEIWVVWKAENSTTRGGIDEKNFFFYFFRLSEETRNYVNWVYGGFDFTEASFFLTIFCVFSSWRKSHKSGIIWIISLVVGESHFRWENIWYFLVTN